MKNKSIILFSLIVTSILIVSYSNGTSIKTNHERLVHMSSSLHEVVVFPKENNIDTIIKKSSSDTPYSVTTSYPLHTISLVDKKSKNITKSYVLSPVNILFDTIPIFKISKFKYKNKDNQVKTSFDFPYTEVYSSYLSFDLEFNSNITDKITEKAVTIHFLINTKDDRLLAQEACEELNYMFIATKHTSYNHTITNIAYSAQFIPNKKVQNYFYKNSLVLFNFLKHLIVDSKNNREKYPTLIYLINKKKKKEFTNEDFDLPYKNTIDLFYMQLGFGICYINKKALTSYYKSNTKKDKNRVPFWSASHSNNDKDLDPISDPSKINDKDDDENNDDMYN